MIGLAVGGIISSLYGDNLYYNDKDPARKTAGYILIVSSELLVCASMTLLVSELVTVSLLPKQG